MSRRIERLAPDNSGRAIEELRLYMADESERMIPTTAFIPAAERYHLMSSIDRWMIRSAFAQYAATYGGHDNTSTPMLMIRLSGDSLDDEHFIEFVHEQFAHAGIPHDAICFSIAEATAMTSLTRLLRFIEAMKPGGCRMALDNFGSGISSFTYLKHLDIDFLKIDGSYVQGMAKDPVDFAKVEAIHLITSAMGIDSIAQNADTLYVLGKLKEIGIRYVQGDAVMQEIAFYPPAGITENTGHPATIG
jgi:EAL domain-containing protein (putative c-di-GMP-specific phosphodiesterase class I)